jgi:hypothetical protein
MSRNINQRDASIYLHRIARFIVETGRPDWMKLEGSRAFDTLRIALAGPQHSQATDKGLRLLANEM